MLSYLGFFSEYGLKILKRRAKPIMMGLHLKSVWASTIQDSEEVL